MLKQKETIPELLLHKKDIVIQSKKQYEKLSEKQYEALQIYKFNGYSLINKFLRGVNPITYNINYIAQAIHTTKSKKDDKALEKFYKEGGKQSLQEFYEFIKKYGPGRLIELIGYIDSIFRKPSWPKVGNLSNIHTFYRGAAVPHHMYNKLVGQEITFSEYVSTSFSINTAMSFYKGSAFGSIMGSENVKPVFYVLKKCEKVPFIFLDWSAVDTHKLEGLKFQRGDEYELLLPRGCKFKLVKKSTIAQFINGYQDEQNRVDMLNNYYNNVRDLTPEFFKLPEVKEKLSIPDIMVMELEFIELVKPIPIELKDTPLQVVITHDMLKPKTAKEIKNMSMSNSESGIIISDDEEPNQLVTEDKFKGKKSKLNVKKAKGKAGQSAKTKKLKIIKKVLTQKVKAKKQKKQT